MKALPTRRAVFVGATGLCVFATGVVAGRAMDQVPDMPAPPADLSRSPEDPPIDLAQHARPLPSRRSAAGAVRAALAHLRALTPSTGETRHEYEQTIRAIASRKWGRELVSTIDSWFLGVGDVAALRYKVRSYSPTRALIALWIVGYVDARDGAPGAVWGRSFMTLVWEQGAWKVAAEDTDSGPWPAPVRPADSPDEVARFLEGFRSFD